MKELTGMVLRIERASMHDGPGLRTVVFLKGCPLRCAWCSTPESQLSIVQVGYKANKCSGCGVCLRVCPQQALRLYNNRIEINRQRCAACRACVTACPQAALIAYGYPLTVSELLRELAKDEVLFYHSEGGITFSGGEPLAQAEYVAAVLQACKAQQIGTAMETSLFAPYAQISPILPWLDHLYVDIKHFASASHRQYTAQGNDRILSNLRRIDASDYTGTIVVRIPLIPTINDDIDNLVATARFCASLQRKPPLELLPYHRIGVGTYEMLGQEYPLQQLASYDPEQAQQRLAELRRAVPQQQICLAP